MSSSICNHIVKKWTYLRDGYLLVASFVWKILCSVVGQMQFVSFSPMDRKKAVLLVMQLHTVVLLSLLFTCVYSRSLGTHRKPGHKKHRFHTDLPWDLTPRKRDHMNRVDECCPSVTEIIQPRGGVSKSGRILELYRDPNSTQSFYQTSCREGVKGHPCKYVGRRSMCVQRYTYTYALVREFNSNGPWRLDYIRVRSGCSCEIKAFYGRRKKDVD